MFQFLFGRKKKSSSVNTPKKPEATESPTATITQPKTAQQWAKSLTGLSQKAHNQQLNIMAEAINNGELNLADAVTALPVDTGLMLNIHFETSDIKGTEAQWLALSVSGFTANVRKYAAQRVVNAEHLTELAKLTKGKDKAVYRIIQKTIEAQAKATDAQNAIIEKQSNILCALQKLADAAVEPMYEAKLKGLQSQWQGIESSKHLNDEFAALAQQVQLKINETNETNQEQTSDPELTAQLTNDEEHPSQVTDNAAQPIQSRQPLIDAFHQQAADLLTKANNTPNTVDKAEIDAALIQFQQAWEAENEQFDAPESEITTFNQLCSAFSDCMTQWVALTTEQGNAQTIGEVIESSNDLANPLTATLQGWLRQAAVVTSNKKPDWFASLETALNRYQQKSDDNRKKEKAAFNSLRSQLRRCQAAIDDGSLRRSSGLFLGAQTQADELDLSQQASLTKLFNETETALEKLRDWQSFAVQPKKEALIEKMRLLVDSPVNPEIRAEQVKEMQAQWKQLSRGLQNRHQDLWETFNALAQEAYEPCKPYFEEQRNLRDINLAKRKELVAQLNTYTTLINPESPDAPEVDKVLQLARNDWRKYTPVERHAGKAVQAEFDSLNKTLSKIVETHHQSVKTEKERIVAEAISLLDVEDLKKATEAAKALQQQWKQSGNIPRQQEQVLWRKFREACDTLFAKRDEQIGEFKADLEHNRVTAQETLNAITELLNADKPTEERSSFERLKTEFNNIGTLPKSHHAKYTAQFKQLCEQFDALCAQEKAHAQDAHWQALIQWVSKTRFEPETAKTWDELNAPKEALSLKTAGEAWSQPASSENEEQLRNATIALEISADIESPASDKAARMALQVNYLQGGIKPLKGKKEVHLAIVEWLAVGSVDQTIYSALERRMIKARQALLK